MCETRELELEHMTAPPLVLELYLKTEPLVLEGKSNAQRSKMPATQLQLVAWSPVARARLAVSNQWAKLLDSSFDLINALQCVTTYTADCMGSEHPQWLL